MAYIRSSSFHNSTGKGGIHRIIRTDGDILPRMKESAFSLPVDDVRIDGDNWGEMTRSQLTRQRDFIDKGTDYCTEVIARLRPARCKVCGLRHKTDTEAYNCCQRQLDNKPAVIDADVEAQIERMAWAGYPPARVREVLCLSYEQMQTVWEKHMKRVMAHYGIANNRNSIYTWRLKRRSGGV